MSLMCIRILLQVLPSSGETTTFSRTSPMFAVVSIGSIFGVVHPHLLSFDVDNAEAQPSQAATIQAVALDHLLRALTKLYGKAH